MADVNQDTDDTYDPTQPQDYGDYNPESIHYEAQDDESAQDEPGYASDNASNETIQDTGYEETATEPVYQPPRSPVNSRSPTATKQFDTTETQTAPPIQTTTNDRSSITSSDT